LVQVIVTSLSPTTFYLFLNDQYIPQMDVESLSISIEVPNESNLGQVVRATLSRNTPTVTGGQTRQTQELFPCTIEVVALDRRLSLTCTRRDSLEGLWVDIGLLPDGTATSLEELQGLRFLLTEGILDCKLTWMDGTSESLYPQ
jgi:hypothetical protein